ncbi:DNA replication and repair protein RadC [Nitrosomonas marina]|uniref:DNA replication and repair protein RadC n=1 Tax=Nitrosomonas marina TaxID=917 RepID=A0A1H9YT04_9PROT|nr:DNA repair protein RadC [Nitrosomonas marina]SES72248.1 DNA replication and repair protein RadC [Nitrosomonas marina]
MTITDWPVYERPREKLLRFGARNLSDTELLAIFLRTGTTGKSAVELARNLINHFGSLGNLFSADKTTLCNFHGVGTAKYAQLQAILEMSRRTLSERLERGHVMNTPQLVRDFLNLSLANKQHEIFMAIFLDAKHHMIATDELFTGTLTQASVYPREVVKRALYHNAAAIIFAHNHPSGSAEPSQADKTLTLTLKKALDLVDVKVLDHFIIGKNEVLSFAEQNLM